MSYMWYTGLGMLLVWFFGMIVSLLTGKDGNGNGGGDDGDDDRDGGGDDDYENG